MDSCYVYCISSVNAKTFHVNLEMQMIAKSLSKEFLSKHFKSLLKDLLIDLIIFRKTLVKGYKIQNNVTSFCWKEYPYFLDYVCILKYDARSIIIITMGHEIIDIKKKNHFKTWRMSKNSVVPLTLNYNSECKLPHGLTKIWILKAKSLIYHVYLFYIWVWFNLLHWLSQQ